MKFVIFLFVFVAAVALAHANPGGLTGVPLGVEAPLLTRTTVVASVPVIRPAIAIAPVATVIKSNPTWGSSALGYGIGAGYGNGAKGVGIYG